MLGRKTLWAIGARTSPGARRCCWGTECDEATEPLPGDVPGVLRGTKARAEGRYDDVEG